MAQNHFILLHVDSGISTERLLDCWYSRMNQDLTFSPFERASAVLIVLDAKKNRTDILAEYIEEEDGTFDTLPLFVLYATNGGPLHSTVVHEYAPFENGVRQVKNTIPQKTTTN